MKSFLSIHIRSGEAIPQIGKRDGRGEIVNLPVEVVHFECIEVARDVERAIRNEASPVVERLSIMLAEIDAPLFHLYGREVSDEIPDGSAIGRSPAGNSQA